MSNPIKPSFALDACKDRFVTRINGRLEIEGKFRNNIPNLILKNPKVLRHIQQEYVDAGWTVSIVEHQGWDLLKIEHPSLVDGE